MDSNVLDNLELASEKDIRECISKCAKKVDVDNVDIKVVFKPELYIPAFSHFNPEPTVFINSDTWHSLTNLKRTRHLLKQICWLLACIKTGREVKSEGEEYRFFAFKLGMINIVPSNKKSELTTLVKDW